MFFVGLDGPYYYYGSEMMVPHISLDILTNFFVPIKTAA